MRKYLLILLGSIVAILCWAKPDFIYRYWFDKDIANMVEGNTFGDVLHVDADVSGLSECMHVLHLQVFDGDDTPGTVVSRLFVKSSVIGGDQLRYWFDNDHMSAKTIITDSGAADIDVSSLSEGLHTLNVQSAGIESSPVRTSMFIKVPQTEGTGSITCVTYVDGTLYKRDQVSPTGGIVHYDMPIAELSEGLHSLSVQLVTPMGGASELKSCYFLRHPTVNELSRMRCFYSVDGISGQTEASVFENGDFSFDVDVASIKDGLHSITYMLTLEDGSVSDIKTGMFYKIPLGGYGISNYCYWINDHDEAITRVDVEGLPQEINLTQLLPVESQPFRSSLFHFEIDKSGQPCAYAANEFHFRVYSNDLHSVEMSKVYADYSVSKKVENITTLDQFSDRITRPCPATNDILWYKVNAEIGDSLQLRADYASILQVFDPNGKEVCSLQGVDATVGVGMHTSEEGTYYIALHDVTSSPHNITLDYLHIHKYAVLDYTPDEAGAADSDVFISLSGNGYDKLVQATLKSTSDVINIEKIDVIDKCHAYLRFKLTGFTKRDLYDLQLVFDDNGEKETLTVDNAFRVAEPIFGDIKVSIYDYPISMIPQPVEVTITNTGNVAYRNIPIELGWSTDNLNGWNIDVALKSDVVNSEESKNPFIFVDDFMDSDEKGALLPMIIDRLESGESTSVILWFNIEIGQNFDMSACIFRPWSLSSDTPWYGTSGEYGPNETQDKEAIDDYDWTYVYGDDEGNCDMTLEEVEELLDSSDNEVNNEYDKIEEISFLKECPFSLRSVQKPKYFIKKYRVIIKKGKGGNKGGNKGSRKSKLTHRWVRSNMSLDPNDILGYVSPAETNYIKKGLKDVFYTIEFENDSTIATAAAHHIEVTNEIDKSKLDISTLKTKMLKISNKTVDLSEFGQNFVTTIDMRPEINVIAQLTQRVDVENSVVNWDILALDPMTLEPTVHYMQGILPVNDSEGNGMGEIIYDISLRDGLNDGTSITNAASIVFDNQEPIVTPTWENIIDDVDPKSCVSRAVAISDTEAILTVDGSDNRSGIWKYDIYCHPTVDSAWTLIAEGVSADDNSEIPVKISQRDGLGFCAIAYDRAGNVEHKELHREATLGNYLLGDANSDGTVDIQDAVLIVQYFIEAPETYLNAIAADFNKDGTVDIQDAVGIVNKYVSTDSQNQLFRKRISLKK